jgi:hypothetical protein
VTALHKVAVHLAARRGVRAARRHGASAGSSGMQPAVRATSSTSRPTAAAEHRCAQVSQLGVQQRGDGATELVVVHAAARRVRGASVHQSILGATRRRALLSGEAHTGAAAAAQAAGQRTRWPCWWPSSETVGSCP